MMSLLLATLLLLPSGNARSPLHIVDLGLGLGGEPNANLSTAVAVQTCVGLMNRDPSVAGAAYTLLDTVDPEWLADTDKICVAGFNYTNVTRRGFPCQATAPRLPLTPRAKLLQTCVAAKKPDGTRLVTGYIRYDPSRSAQQLITPNIVTLAAVLDAIPLPDGDPLAAQLPKVFDALEEFNSFSALQATEYMHTHFVNHTSTMAQMNPGWDVHRPTKPPTKPALTQDLNPGLIDYIVKERLFNFFMMNQCVPHTAEHALMERIVTQNPWPRPIAVLGYDDTWAIAGDLFEAETTCVKEHNMGQIASDGVNNLAYYSSKPSIAAPLRQNQPVRQVAFDASKTYVALVIGDGDSIKHMKRWSRGFMLHRVQRCHADPEGCFPLVWSLSPNLRFLAPDWMRWYYDHAQNTTHDHFVLPPSGDLYSYPGEMPPDVQAQYVANTERDGQLMNTSAMVEWEMLDTWTQAVKTYYPRYSKRGVVRSMFMVNVPYMVPVEGVFKRGEFFRVLDDGEHPVILFKPREWRGANSNTSKQSLTVPLFAKEINAYPPGTATAIYMTTDGGVMPAKDRPLHNLYDLVAQLAEHVEVVDQETLADFALRQHRAARLPPGGGS